MKQVEKERQIIYNLFSMRNKVIPKTHNIKYNNISASSYDEKTRN